MYYSDTYYEMSLFLFVPIISTSFRFLLFCVIIQMKKDSHDDGCRKSHINGLCTKYKSYKSTLMPIIIYPINIIFLKENVIKLWEMNLK